MSRFVATASTQATRPLKVLFLTRYPVEGASSRYRVYQYLPHLEALGVSCTVQSFMDSDLYRLSFSPGKTLRKVRATIAATLRRFWTVQGHSGYDIVYMQRELLPFGPPLLERWMRRRGARLIFDYDDALFIKKPSRFNPLATSFRSGDKVLDIFRLVDTVVAGNDWLRDQAAVCAPHAVTVEVAEDTTRFQAHAPREREGVTIGWLGSTSTVKYLRLIEKPLRAIAERHPGVGFELMGGGEFSMEGVPWKLADWSLEGEVDALQRFDIGLMPLPMDDWAKGKSGGKARTYMAAGVVPVCSSIGYNKQLIKDGVTGFLVQDEAQWEFTLRQLIENPELRQSVSVRARRDVEARFSPAIKARELVDIFNHVLAR